MKILMKSKRLTAALAIFFFFAASSVSWAKKEQGVFKLKEIVTIYVKDRDGVEVASGKGIVTHTSGIIETRCYLISKWLEDVGHALIIKTRKGVYYDIEKLVSFNRKMDIAYFKIAEQAAAIYESSQANRDEVNNDSRVVEIEPLEADVDDIGIIVEIELPEDDAANMPKEEPVSPVNAEMYFMQAKHYEAGRRYAEAENAYKHALKLNPGYTEALSGLGMVYYKLGRHLEAVNTYENMLGINPDFRPAYNKLGTNYMILGNYSSAADVFKRSILLDPEDALTYFNLGIAYFLEGNKNDAADIYIKLKRLDGKLAEDLFDLLY